MLRLCKLYCVSSNVDLVTFSVNINGEILSIYSHDIERYERFFLHQPRIVTLCQICEK